jgi:hypothetical protein
MTKPNVKRINTLVDYLKALPKGAYNQGSYGIYYDYYEDDDESKGKCAIGHAMDIPSFKRAGFKATVITKVDPFGETYKRKLFSYKGHTDEETAFAALMGITVDQAHWVSFGFMGDPSKEKREAIKKLEALAEGRVEEGCGEFKILPRKKVKTVEPA